MEQLERRLNRHESISTLHSERLDDQEAGLERQGGVALSSRVRLEQDIGYTNRGMIALEGRIARLEDRYHPYARSVVTGERRMPRPVLRVMAAHGRRRSSESGEEVERVPVSVVDTSSGSSD